MGKGPGNWAKGKQGFQKTRNGVDAPTAAAPAPRRGDTNEGTQSGGATTPSQSDLYAYFRAERPTIKNADVGDADLTGVDLSHKNLPGANLSGANLSGVDLRWTDLTGADLSGANLTGAHLTWTDLTGADLTDANLSGAKLGLADIRGANLTGADLRGANLENANLTGANLTDANLDGASVNGADLHGVRFHGQSTNDEATAAIVAVKTIQHRPREAHIDQAAAIIHDQWLLRNSDTATQGDKVPFSALPSARQDTYREQALTAHETLSKPAPAPKKRWWQRKK